MSQTCCRDCKRVREHVASLLPFRVLEAAVGKPLRIGGVAITVGLSRNLNVYTPEELQAFASQLVGAPMYIEHVSVSNATGKVTKAFYDSVSRCLLYEAEVYDPVIADKIRNGMIQHVSVGADYDALDVVDAKVPHGLHNAELSLVAVPGIPEANIQVLERLRESLGHKAGGDGHVKLKLSVKEALGETDVFCIFCDNPADFFVSICQSCVDKFSLPAAGQVLNALSSVKVSEVAAGASVGLGVQGQGYGVESLDEKDLDKIAEKVAAKVGEKSSLEVEKLNGALVEAKAKQVDAEGKLKIVEESKADAVGKLETANKTIEDLRRQLPGGGLLVNPPKMMAVSEHVAVLEKLVPPPTVERSSMSLQYQGQLVRAEIFKANERLKAK